VKKLFASLFGKGSRRGQKPGVRLELLALEERCNPSASIYNGELYIYGTNAADNVSVRQETYSGVSYYRVTENGYSSWHRASSVWGGKIHFYGYGGDDRLDAWVGVVVDAHGMEGIDVLYGGWGHDWLDGGNGTDYLFGRDGNDTLIAGCDSSYNQLYGGNGGDVLYGGYGGDAMYGEAGGDSLYGSYGGDYMDGGNDADYMYGEAGHDYMVGGNDYAWNYMEGGEGNDTMQGALATDYLIGQAGDDSLAGNWGDDELYGGEGADRLYGQSGNDYLNGGDDGVADYLDGDVGSDRFEVEWYWNGSGWANRDTPFDYDPYGQLDSMVNYY